ncbi:MAG: hypothetical protein HRT38_05765 [Alteromonadaceae bacterium]|nr:hypothetical protein [Alteromonadaceae bacterium]
MTDPQNNENDKLLSDDALTQLLQFHSTLSDDEFTIKTVKKINLANLKRYLILSFFGVLAFLSLFIYADISVLPLETITSFLALFGQTANDKLTAILILSMAAVSVWLVAKENDFI